MDSDKLIKNLRDLTTITDQLSQRMSNKNAVMKESIEDCKKYNR